MTREELLAVIEKKCNTPESKIMFQVAILVMQSIGAEAFTAAINQKTKLERELAVYRLFFKHCVKFVEKEDESEPTHH